MAMLASASCVRNAWCEVTITLGSETKSDSVLFLFCRASIDF